MNWLPMQPRPFKNESKPLVEAFAELPEPRVAGRCEHLLHEVLVMAVCGLLVGGESFYDMEDFAIEREQWLRGFLTLPGGIPRHDTFNRIFQALCPRGLCRVLRALDAGRARTSARRRTGCGR